MPHGHKLIQHNLPVNAQALSTLAGRAALSLNSVMNGIDATFLMKRYRYALQMTGRTIGDDGPVGVFLNKGDATAAELSTAMQEQNTAGPSDTTQVLTQDNPWIIYQNTIKLFEFSGLSTEAVLFTDWQSIGGKNGIPALEGVGFALHAFNFGSGALDTGSTINGMCHVQGVWLRD